jgi:hypothetical protein
LTGRWGKGTAGLICTGVLSAAWAGANGQAAGANGQAAGANAPSYTFQNSESSAVEHEKLMTKQQAKELLDSVDTIMAFASADTGLAGVPHVKRKLISRDEVTGLNRMSRSRCWRMS